MNLKAFRYAATFSFSVAMAGLMFAQGTPSGQPTTPRGQGMQNMDGQTVTVTGCLVRASDVQGSGAAATSGGTATAGAAGSSGSDFVLANVQMRSTSPGGTTAGGTGTTGTTGTPTTGSPTTGSPTTGSPTTGSPTTGTPEATAGAPGARGMNLRLTASGNDQLTEHVNKQVEVTGRLSMSNAGNRGGAGATGATGTTGTTGTPSTTGAPGTTGTTGTTGAAGTSAGAAGRGGQNQMGQLQVQTIRATGQSCTASGQ